MLIPIAAALIALAAPLLISGCDPNSEALLERFRQQLCMRNQKRIVAAARMYAADWEGVFPWVGTYSSGFYGHWDADGAPFWGDSIRDYLNDGDHVFICPNVENDPSPSYAWNRHLSGLRSDLVQYPAACPLVWDWAPGYATAPGIPLNGGYECDDWEWYPRGDGLPTPCQMATACSRHHREPEYSYISRVGLVLAFVDGHAGFEWPLGSRFQRCADSRIPGYPHGDDAGVKISMYPMDPML